MVWCFQGWPWGSEHHRGGDALCGNATVRHAVKCFVRANLRLGLKTAQGAPVSCFVFFLGRHEHPFVLMIVGRDSCIALAECSLLKMSMEAQILWVLGGVWSLQPLFLSNSKISHGDFLVLAILFIILTAWQFLNHLFIIIYTTHIFMFYCYM